MGSPKNTPTIKDIDKGYKELAKEVFGFRNPKLAVGILSNEGSQVYEGSDATVLDVATWNEFGTERIPSRSFIRAWFDQNLPAIKKKMQGLLVAVIKRKITKEQALEQMGQWMVGSMQARIATSIPPPNAPSTIAQKRGSTTTLIDTGVLRNSITYKVED